VEDDFEEMEALAELREREKDGRYIGEAIVCVCCLWFGDLVWNKEMKLGRLERDLCVLIDGSCCCFVALMGDC
jgi:hypothetical protein